MKRIGIRLLSLTAMLTGLAAMSHAKGPDVAADHGTEDAREERVSQS
jgi:hypothetical protein